MNLFRTSTYNDKVVQFILVKLSVCPIIPSLNLVILYFYPVIVSFNAVTFSFDPVILTFHHVILILQ